MKFNLNIPKIINSCLKKKNTNGTQGRSLHARKRLSETTWHLEIRMVWKNHLRSVA